MSNKMAILQKESALKNPSRLCLEYKNLCVTVCMSIILFCSLGSRCLNRLGFHQYITDDDLISDLVDEGRELIKRGNLITSSIAYSFWSFCASEQFWQLNISRFLQLMFSCIIIVTYEKCFFVCLSCLHCMFYNLFFCRKKEKTKSWRWRESKMGRYFLSLVAQDKKIYPAYWLAGSTGLCV